MAIPRKLKVVTKGRKYPGCTVGVTSYIHDLVARTFIGPKPVGMQVLHLDDNPWNNNVDNLKYGTHQENMDLMWQHGRQKVGKNRFGSKLNEEVVKRIRIEYVAGGVTMQHLADRLGVTDVTIWKIIHRVKWKHV